MPSDSEQRKKTPHQCFIISKMTSFIIWYYFWTLWRTFGGVSVVLISGAVNNTKIFVNSVMSLKKILFFGLLKRLSRHLRIASCISGKSPWVISWSTSILKPPNLQQTSGWSEANATRWLIAFLLNSSSKFQEIDIKLWPISKGEELGK